MGGIAVQAGPKHEFFDGSVIGLSIDFEVTVREAEYRWTHRFSQAVSGAGKWIFNRGGALSVVPDSPHHNHLKGAFGNV